MGRLAAAYPSDLEARAFYALSLLGLAARRLGLSPIPFVLVAALAWTIFN